MKVKLLKKLRKRFKWLYLGELQEIKRMPRKYWQVLDSKGTDYEKIEDVLHYSMGDMVRVDSPSIAEYLTLRLMGIMFVYKHRKYRAKMKNRSFNKKHFA